jgi:cytoskeletal protein RodZ
MGKRAAFVLVLLLSLGFARTALGGQVTLAWDPNPEPEVSGYRLHYGLSSGDYTTTIDVGNVTTHVLDGLTEGRAYFFVVTAYDRDGDESGYSNEVSCTPPVPTSTLSVGFESAGELDAWGDLGSGARLELAVGERFEGDSSLRLSGGGSQAAGRTFAGLPAGRTIVVSGAVKVVGTTSPVKVRLNGANDSAGTQAEFVPNSRWQYFAVPRTITSQDAAGLEVSVTVDDPAATVYVDSLSVSEDVYRSDFSSKAGWDNRVYNVYGGSALTTDASGGVDGSAALRISGGTNRVGRFTIYGLPVGIAVTLTGWVSADSAAPAVVRMNGLYKTDWRQTQVAAAGGGRFSLSKTITELDAAGLDLNVILPDPAADLLLDDVRVSLSEPATHAITASSGLHGRIEPPGTTLVSDGASLSHSIIPDSCYQVTLAEASDGTVGNFTSHVFPDVSRDETITASFDRIAYAIDASASGGGTISSPGVSQVSCGDSKTYVFTPDPGKRGARLIIGGVPQPYAPTYTFPAVDSDQTISVEFESVPPTFLTAGFESAGELDAWDNLGSGARLELEVGENFEGNSSLRVSGGGSQAAGRTFTGLPAGRTIVVSGAVKVVGTTSPVKVRLNGANDSAGTQAQFVANSRWQYFAVPRTITSQDAAGLEVSVTVDSPAATVYVDSLTVSEDLYRSDFTSKAGWDNRVYNVYGGSELVIDESGGVDGSAALRLSGGTNRVGRFTIYGLPAGVAVALTGWVSADSAAPAVVRMNGLYKTDWTQTQVAAAGGGRFSLTKTITELDTAGLDLNVILPDPTADLLLDDVKLELTASQ